MVADQRGALEPLAVSDGSLEDRLLVERAEGVLVARRGGTAEEAYAVTRPSAPTSTGKGEFPVDSAPATPFHREFLPPLQPGIGEVAGFGDDPDSESGRAVVSRTGRAGRVSPSRRR